jgi:hypothetical protein
MKNKILLLTTAIFITVTSIAQDLGKIVIRNASNNYPKFIASLNGIRLTNEYAPMVAFPYLDESAYRVKILQAGSLSMLTFTISGEPKYLSKYVITKDSYGAYSIILESKSLMLDGIDPETPVVTTPTVTTPTVTTPATVTAVATMPIAPAPTVSITNISAQEFNETLAAVNRESFDDKRLNKAKQVFDDEILSTNQVINVVKVFSFDDSKLDFAKWAYSRTLDKKNYYKVEDQFSFSSTKSNLGNYVKSQK